MNNLSLATLQELPKLLLPQNPLLIVPNHFAAQDSISRPVAHRTAFEGSIVYIVVHVALQDRPRAFIARIPDREISIVAWSDTALLSIEAIKFRGIGSGQLHEARETEASFVCGLTGWSLIEEQRQSCLETWKAIGDFGEAWDGSVYQAEFLATRVIVFARRMVGREGCEGAVGD